MLDPGAIIDLVAAAMNDNADLLALMPNIFAGHHSYPTSISKYERIDSLAVGDLMVCHESTLIVGRSNGIDHQLSAYYRSEGSPTAVFHAMREGIVTSTGQKFKTGQISFSLHPPNITGMYSRSLYLNENLAIDYHEITISLTERGVDN